MPVKVVHSTEVVVNTLSYQEAVRLSRGTPFKCTSFESMPYFFISMGNGSLPMYIWGVDFDFNKSDGSFDKPDYRFRILPPVTITFSA